VKDGLIFRRMLAKLDRLLGRITMYRLILLWLLVLLVAGMVFAVAGLLPYSALDLLCSTVFLVAVSLISNTIFAKIFKASTGTDSVYITALILALIITPTAPFANLPFLAWAAFLATASKYLLAWRRRHLFNPAALAVVITSLFLGESASWWVGNVPMLPLVLLGGLLIVRQMRRLDLVWAFVMAVMVTLLGFAIFAGSQLAVVTEQLVLHSPLFFFAFAMLTEPLTTPPSRALQIWYGALVGVLFVPQVHLGGLYFTPEIALLAGNLFSYLAGPKTNLMLRLKAAERLSNDTYEFVFDNDSPFSFKPGQYMEWTLPHTHEDSRGNRRFFTLSSSPTQREVRMGIKFYPKPSTFKQRLLQLRPGEVIAAGHVAGDFTLPRDRRKKLAFVAGGIGITPFASMIRHMLDTQDRRDAVMLCANWRVNDVAYDPLLREACEQLGVRTVHALSACDSVPAGWQGAVGFIDSEMIRDVMPDYQQRTFYVSGPPAMVTAAKRAIAALGVKSNRIRTDYFPGFA
jgi:ferredoxin-NADP reductase/Na+-translocating ferredoxin:NAD+ oxidoreductase RnfD subunit